MHESLNHIGQSDKICFMTSQLCMIYMATLVTVHYYYLAGRSLGNQHTF